MTKLFVTTGAVLALSTGLAAAECMKSQMTMASTVPAESVQVATLQKPLVPPTATAATPATTIAPAADATAETARQ
ncbi:hypothetical protein [Chthonobacter rhizosphaerae]|uniref:hypothetical protein n=1 Tax=Chthonobacter rhizosphaerae TaxID=2735553 RepID=UPI0015EF5C8F|nr:hypothetical protein [Chthonobacter rhizosphaerae]